MLVERELARRVVAFTPEVILRNWGYDGTRRDVARHAIPRITRQQAAAFTLIDGAERQSYDGAMTEQPLSLAKDLAESARRRPSAALAMRDLYGG